MPVRVLAKIGNAIPAILESDFGAGKVVIFNTTANDAWSDLPRRPSFVPLVDRLIAHLSGNFGRREVLVGEPISVPIGPFETTPEVSVTTPSGEILQPALRRVGGQFVLQLDAVETPGIYKIKFSGTPGERAFVVQASRGDSSLARMKPELLEQWWAPAKFEAVIDSGSRPASGGEAAISPKRLPLWPWFAGIAALVLMGEMFLVHWLCPKINPTLAQNQVPRHGLLRQARSLE